MPKTPAVPYTKDWPIFANINEQLYPLFRIASIEQYSPLPLHVEITNLLSMLKDQSSCQSTDLIQLLDKIFALKESVRSSNTALKKRIEDDIEVVENRDQCKTYRDIMAEEYLRIAVEQANKLNVDLPNDLQIKLELKTSQNSITAIARDNENPDRDTLLEKQSKLAKESLDNLRDSIEPILEKLCGNISKHIEEISRILICFSDNKQLFSISCTESDIAKISSSINHTNEIIASIHCAHNKLDLIKSKKTGRSCSSSLPPYSPPRMQQNQTLPNYNELYGQIKKLLTENESILNPICERLNLEIKPLISLQSDITNEILYKALTNLLEIIIRVLAAYNDSNYLKKDEKNRLFHLAATLNTIGVKTYFPGDTEKPQIFISKEIIPPEQESRWRTVIKQLVETSSLNNNNKKITRSESLQTNSQGHVINKTSNPILGIMTWLKSAWLKTKNFFLKKRKRDDADEMKCEKLKNSMSSQKIDTAIFNIATEQTNQPTSTSSIQRTLSGTTLIADRIKSKEDTREVRSAPIPKVNPPLIPGSVIRTSSGNLRFVSRFCDLRSVLPPDRSIVMSGTPTRGLNCS